MVTSRFAIPLLLLTSTSPAFAQPEIPPAEPYKDVVVELEKLIKHELDDKKLPATAETIYRVGSVSKLFTDVAVMQLVEEGKIDLDAPVGKYIPEFKPTYKEGEKPITLRMLMSHRSGLIREPPVGNYFDPTEPSLEKSVQSLNGIGLIYPPESHLKYSNAAIGVVGYAVEKSQKEKYEKYVQRRVLDALGMKSSSFLLTPEVKKGLADAVMWTYHGREFPAPAFQLGVAPAGCMYSTVLDLAKFQSCLFANGKVDGKPVIKPETIAEMFRPQFADKDAKSGFGLGFSLSEFEGKRRVGHGGAIYGFATTFYALPSEKIGVIVVTSRDVSNAVGSRIADDALRQMLAVKTGKPLPKIEFSNPLPVDEARALVGHYQANDREVELFESFGSLYLLSSRGGSIVRLRKSGKDLIVDDTEAWGIRIGRGPETLTIGGTTYTKQKPSFTPPPGPPAKYAGLIGEYGYDHLPLYIYEKNGKLHALIEHTEIDPLTEESENVFAFPADRGMYHGEKLIFTRDKTGRATKVTAASVVFERRRIDGENGETFKIKPVRPVAEIRKEALAAKPPVEKGEFRQPELVDLATIEGIKFDIRYATDNNFLDR